MTPPTAPTPAATKKKESKSSSGKQNLSLSNLSTNTTQPVRLEICSGHGDWLVDRAQRDPASLWVGLEMRYERVFLIWAKSMMTVNRSAAAAPTKSKKETKIAAPSAGVDNVRIIGGEAHAVLQSSLSSNSIDEIFINYPDPPVWIGSKFRLVDESLILELHRVLKSDAASSAATPDDPTFIISGTGNTARVNGSVTLVTDDEPYHLSMVKEFARHPTLFRAQAASLSSLPADYGTSYFDRLWNNGERTNRYLLKYYKI